MDKNENIEQSKLENKEEVKLEIKEDLKVKTKEESKVEMPSRHLAYNTFVLSHIMSLPSHITHYGTRCKLKIKLYIT